MFRVQHLGFRVCILRGRREGRLGRAMATVLPATAKGALAVTEVLQAAAPAPPLGPKP